MQFPRSIETLTNWESSLFSLTIPRLKPPKRRHDKFDRGDINHKKPRDGEQSGYAKAYDSQYKEAKSVSFNPMQSTTDAHHVETYDSQNSFSGSDSEIDNIGPRGNIPPLFAAANTSSSLILL